MLRYLYISKLKDKSQCARLGSFTVTSSQAQHDATKALLQYIMGGTLDRLQLLQLLHALLVSLVQHQIKGSDKMKCPTDQSLCLMSLKTDGCFQLANSLTQDCAKLQFTFFSIVVHIARMEGKGLQEFVPFDWKSWEKSDEDVTMGGSESELLELQTCMAGEEAAHDETGEVDEFEDEGEGEGEMDVDTTDEAQNVHRYCPPSAAETCCL